MKPRGLGWEKLSYRRVERPVVRLIDLPGVRELENDKLLVDRLNGVGRDTFSRRCDEVSMKLFGIKWADTEFPLPDYYWELDAEELCRLYSRQDTHDRKFATRDMSERDALQHLKKWGWDLTDDQGRTLLTFSHFVRQVEAVAKNIMGHAPDFAEIGRETWANNIETDAQRFVKSRRGRHDL